MNEARTAASCGTHNHDADVLHGRLAMKCTCLSSLEQGRQTRHRDRDGLVVLLHRSRTDAIGKWLAKPRFVSSDSARRGTFHPKRSCAFVPTGHIMGFFSPSDLFLYATPHHTMMRLLLLLSLLTMSLLLLTGCHIPLPALAPLPDARALHGGRGPRWPGVRPGGEHHPGRPCGVRRR